MGGKIHFNWQEEGGNIIGNFNLLNVLHNFIVIFFFSNMPNSNTLPHPKLTILLCDKWGEELSTSTMFGTHAHSIKNEVNVTVRESGLFSL